MGWLVIHPAVGLLGPASADAVRAEHAARAAEVCSFEME
jgi:hypothetical protein